MKHPFWLANSILLLLLIGTIVFVFISRTNIPPRREFVPESTPMIKKTAAKIDTNKIYHNDLFNTYREPVTLPHKPIGPSSMPKPPIPKQPSLVTKTAPKFLEPLQISLSGIMVTGEEKTNVAIIKDTKTGASRNYIVGDRIVDAQLIRILKQKIILIRSNGQQETLYVHSRDAQKDTDRAKQAAWKDGIIKNTAVSYTIDPYVFIKQVSNISEFIDQLNLSTVYQKGVSIGTRIGSTEPDSLAPSLGLARGDIITRVNNIAATDTDNRYSIYKDIINADLNDSITVEIQRKNQTILFEYTLAKVATKKLNPTAQESVIPEKPYEQIQKEKEELFKQQHQLAPTLQTMKRADKQAMLQHGKTKPLNTQQRKKGVLLNSVVTHEPVTNMIGS